LVLPSKFAKRKFRKSELRNFTFKMKKV